MILHEGDTEWNEKQKELWGSGPVLFLELCGDDIGVFTKISWDVYTNILFNFLFVSYPSKSVCFKNRTINVYFLI